MNIYRCVLDSVLDCPLLSGSGPLPPIATPQHKHNDPTKATHKLHWRSLLQKVEHWMVAVLLWLSYISMPLPSLSESVFVEDPSSLQFVDASVQGQCREAVCHNPHPGPKNVFIYYGSANAQRSSRSISSPAAHTQG